MKIAIVTYKSSDLLGATANEEDIVIAERLRNRGVEVQSVIWDDLAVNWQDFDWVIIKSTWDYHERTEVFIAWLQALQRLRVPVLNPVDRIIWNTDKHYLREIAAAGLAVIPSVFIEANQGTDISSLFDILGSDAIILKPCISAGSKNTYHIQRDSYSQCTAQLQNVLESEALIAQPFAPEIISEGEWSFLFFNGQFSHAIIKTPKTGDFRVQQQFGGSTRKVQPTRQQIDAARAYVAHFAPDCLYARVDAIMRDGKPMLMELELIEPYLFLSSDANAVERYTDALEAITQQTTAQKFS